MRRREVFALVGGAIAAWPLAGLAQLPDTTRRVAILHGLPENDPAATAQLTAFREGMAALAWFEGRNLRIDTRFGAGVIADAPGRMTELLALGPEVIVVHSVGVPTAKAATQTVPMVFVGGSADPVGAGWVESLARPGGNLTGFTASEPSFGPKWLELLKEVAPNVRRVVVLSRLASWGRDIAAVAERFAVEVTAPAIQSQADVEPALNAVADKPDFGLILPDDALTFINRKPIIELALRHRLPLVAGNRRFAVDGGLLYYGSDYVDLYRRSAVYADRILKGAKPADLPVQQPTTFELVINQKTAKAIGLTVPPSILARADEVIE
jgi:putative ABC transport system substrate-binding protein